MYDSYKHHSKYPFDNYRINVLQWGVICLWYSINIDLWLTIVNVIKNVCQFRRLCVGV